MTSAPRSLPRALVGALALLLTLSAGGTAALAQDNPADFPSQVVTPVAGGWTLLVNLADAAPPRHAPRLAASVGHRCLRL